jgi:hypothetical protein
MVLSWGWDPLTGSISSCGDINATLLCASKWIASPKPLSPTTQQLQRSLVPCSLTVEITKNSENQEPNFPGPTMALPTLPDTTYWAGRATLCDHGCMDARCKLVNGIIKRGLSNRLEHTRTGSVQKWWTLKLDATVEHFLKLFQLGISSRAKNWVRAAHLPGAQGKSHESPKRFFQPALKKAREFNRNQIASVIPGNLWTRWWFSSLPGIFATARMNDEH